MLIQNKRLSNPTVITMIQIAKNMNISSQRNTNQWKNWFLDYLLNFAAHSLQGYPRGR